MKNFKRLLRIVGLIILIILASSGIGFTGHFLSNNRERYLDKEIKIEQVDKKEDESESESKEVKN